MAARAISPVKYDVAVIFADLIDGKPKLRMELLFGHW